MKYVDFLGGFIGRDLRNRVKPSVFVIRYSMIETSMKDNKINKYVISCKTYTNDLEIGDGREKRA